MATKTVLITGGSRGIGKEIAKRFLNDGYRLIIVSHSQEELNQCSTELNSTDALYWCIDLGQKKVLRKRSEYFYCLLSEAGGLNDHRPFGNLFSPIGAAAARQRAFDSPIDAIQ